MKKNIQQGLSSAKSGAKEKPRVAYFVLRRVFLSKPHFIQNTNSARFQRKDLGRSFHYFLKSVRKPSSLTYVSQCDLSNTKIYILGEKSGFRVTGIFAKSGQKKMLFTRVSDFKR